ncbi:LysR family transcriptional regulator [Serratia sp. JUb9]|uniref:LysR family transcriptional regulator n=1 Tax=Serratia rhizosphaerae TaxID=2597702 RepID=A0ABX6GMN4_9GAMM|nr:MULTISPECIES: LysR substrate-binding domain-containing protein [Serratia]MEB6337272.1 LysR substrate-binding domain-containing protein [Serratia rhizosphaerae]QHA87524.1 LysR family transcriptional regulator [Serratia rhizosphaerae]QNK32752.1 LysR family transcriptional regulator [Serratia sp. JUb9]QPT13034.1 LysR family transcriptional regulator [Serratia rubidaea]
MRYLPKLQQLRVFQQVIRSGSIRGAARALQQSQPAVSRSLRELEQALDTQLIIRSNQGMTLTESGRIFAVRMQFILEELQRAADEIQQISQHSQGTVAMGLSSLLALTVLPMLADAFRKQFPQVNLVLQEAQLSTLLPALREGRLDFAVGSISPELPLEDLVREPLFNASFCIVARRGHPLANARSLDALRQAKWLLPETDMGYYQHLQSVLGDFYQQLETPPVRSDSVICGLNMVLASDYLTIVARAMARPLHLQEQVVTLPIDTLPQAQYCVLYSQRSPLTVTARRLLDLLHGQCQRYAW